jgi:hypothetical protein
VNERGAFWSNSLAIAGSRALLGVVKTGTLLHRPARAGE